MSRTTTAQAASKDGGGFDLDGGVTKLFSITVFSITVPTTMRVPDIYWHNSRARVRFTAMSSVIT